MLLGWEAGAMGVSCKFDGIFFFLFPFFLLFQVKLLNTDFLANRCWISQFEKT